MGKVEGQICSQAIGSCEDEEPSNDERCRQEEVIGTDESPLGGEEKGEGIVKALNSYARSFVLHPVTMTIPD